MRNELMNAHAKVSRIRFRDSEAAIPKRSNYALEERLLDGRRFKSACSLEGRVPCEPGVYCIRIIDPSNLPRPYSERLEKRKQRNLYIGIAADSLKKRLLDQELRGTGHGTFFRSIGAIFGFRPSEGSLVGKSNPYNYQFGIRDKAKIVNLINRLMEVNWVVADQELERLETRLIGKYLPLLNIGKNPEVFQALIDSRLECRRIANALSQPGISSLNIHRQWLLPDDSELVSAQVCGMTAEGSPKLELLHSKAGVERASRTAVLTRKAS